MNEREFAELAAGRALGALSEADQRRFEAALAAHPEWQAIADDDLDTAAALADGLAPVAPPPALRAELLAQIARTPQTGATPDADERDASHRPVASAEASGPADAATRSDAPAPQKRSWRRIMFGLAAGLALIVGAGIATTTIVSQLQTPASVVALDEIRSAPDAEQQQVQLASGGSATAHWSAQIGKAVLVASGLDELDPGRSYELWFVRGDQPIPAGVFDAEDGAATALLDVPMQEGDVIAVTVEQAGGSPSGKPTTDPVIVIPTA